MTEASTTAHNAETEVVDNTTALDDDKPKSIKTIRACVIGNNVLNVPFFICSILLLDQPNQGFNALLWACVSFLKGLYNYMLWKKGSLAKFPITFGAWLGSSMIMVFLYFTTGIYWGALSNCNDPIPSENPVDNSHFKCEDTETMVALCTFSIMLFCNELVMVCTLLKAKTVLMTETEEDEESGSGLGGRRKKSGNWWEVENSDANEPLIA